MNIKESFCFFVCWISIVTVSGAAGLLMGWCLGNVIWDLTGP